MQRISPTGSPTGSPTDSLEDATSLPTHTLSSSQSSSDNTLWVECGHFMPFDQKPVSIIGTIVKEKYDIFFPTFSAVPPDVKQQMWAEFKKIFTIPEECEGDVKRLFRQKAGKLIRGNMWQSKKLYMATEERADWLAPTMWTKAIAHWQSKGFKKKSKVNKANRNRINSKGLPVGKHTGGRRSTHDWRMTMERDFKRKVLGAELFATLHTKRKEKKLVDVVAESVQECFTQAIPEIMPYFGKGEEIPKELFDKADTTFVNCVRDEVKGRIYGLGNLTEEYSTGTSAHPSFLSHGKVAKLTEQLTQLTTENVGLHEEIVVLCEKASESERMAAGLDAEIKRILAEQEKHAEEMRADQERRDAKIRDELRAEQEQKEAQMMKMFAEKEEKDAARDADNAYIKQMLEQFKAAGFSVAPKQ